MRISKNKLLERLIGQKGWSVVEVLIGFTVVALIFLISAPGINALVMQKQLQKTSSNLFSSLALAQSEAVKRRSTVRVCPSSDGATCRQDGDWNRGWLVFTDGNANNIVEDIEILEHLSPPHEQILIHAKGELVGHVSFNIAGLVPERGLNKGAFDICYTADDEGYQKIVVGEDGLIDAQTMEGACGS